MSTTYLSGTVVYVNGGGETNEARFHTFLS